MLLTSGPRTIMNPKGLAKQGGHVMIQNESFEKEILLQLIWYSFVLAINLSILLLLYLCEY